jgi:DNA mismatch endonuclease (patch repair protein)
MDIVSKQDRSRMMARVRGTNTAPELKVRKTLHKLGFRFRIHRRDLPGTPDIVLPRFKSVILVHGCFWHRHEGCREASVPATRKEFWRKKFAENTERDRKNIASLRKMGWRVLVIWQCEAESNEALVKKIIKFLH